MIGSSVRSILVKWVKKSRNLYSDGMIGFQDQSWLSVTADPLVVGEGVGESGGRVGFIEDTRALNICSTGFPL